MQKFVYLFLSICAINISVLFKSDNSFLTSSAYPFEIDIWSFIFCNSFVISSMINSMAEKFRPVKAFFKNGGIDETRTRDLLRDRQTL